MPKRIFECEQDTDGRLVLRFHPANMPHCSDDARQQMGTAGREALLAVRSLVDWAIKQMEDMEKKPQRRRTKIKAE